MMLSGAGNSQCWKTSKLSIRLNLQLITATSSGSDKAERYSAATDVRCLAFDGTRSSSQPQQVQASSNIPALQCRWESMAARA